MANNQLMMINPFEELETGRKRAYAGYEAGQAAAQREALNELYAQALDPRTGQVNVNALYGGLAQRRMGAMIPGLEAEQAKLTELRAKAAQEETKSMEDRMRFWRRMIPTDSRLAPAWVMGTYNDPAVGPVLRQLGSPEDVIANIPNDPAGYAKWAESSALFADELIDAELKRRELGVRERTVSVQEKQATTAEAQERRLAAPPRAAGGGVATPSAMPSVEPPKLKQGERWNPQTQRVEIVPGSDLYNKSKKIHSADFSTLRGVEGQRNLAIQKIDKLLAPENAGAFENLFGGYNAYVTSQLSGKTADLKNQLESLKSNLKTAGLQLIKTGSGGAIGQITEREWPILEGMIATLSPTMTEEEARNALGGIKTFMQNLATNAQETYDASWAESQFYKAPPDKPPSKLSPEDQQALDWANANPNDPRAAKIKAALGAK